MSAMPEKLKNMFFTRSSIGDMADVIGRNYPAFDKKGFVNSVFNNQFEAMELKTRMRHTTECLHRFLPDSYKKAITILEKAAPGVKGFESMCLPDYVELYGLDDWDVSLEAMALFTRYSSSEFAVRPFIIKDPKRTMAWMKKLAGDKHKNVRRFASEGCRPRLPWAMALPVFKKNPSPIFPVLNKLKNDDSEFVRRSVANNLNDISKDHPERVLETCEKWLGKTANTDRVVKHACRTLLKAGNTRAMRLFGFGDPAKIAVAGLKSEPATLAIGKSLQFGFTLKVNTGRPCDIRLEYAVTFAKARGTTSKKVFKISEKSYQPGSYTVAKKHAFANMSTRTHYPGPHTIAIVVNGVEKAAAKVKLTR
jgi:3-methyladenine DNA glycosylase AlkC